MDLYGSLKPFSRQILSPRLPQIRSFAGKKFAADVSEDGFEACVGDLCSWRVRWPAVREKGENDRVFMLYSGSTVFSVWKKVP